MQHRVSSLDNQSRLVLNDIRNWFQSPLGDHVLQTESAMLNQLLPAMFGYHLAQISVQQRTLFEPSKIRNKFAVDLEQSSNSTLVASPARLPLATDGIDVVLLHHLLDYVESPQEVLKEVSRVTMPMGHVIVIGFNPMSSWGLWGALARYRNKAPWSGSFIRPGRLMDWLNLLNFKIDRAQYDIYRPPISGWEGKVTDYSQGVSRNLNLPVGSVYVIVAQKHVGSIKPIRPVWSRQPAFGGLSVVRSVKHQGAESLQHPDPSQEY